MWSFLHIWTNLIEPLTLHHGPAFNVGHSPSSSALRGNRKWLQTRGRAIKSTPGLWRTGGGGGARGCGKWVKQTSRPSVPPAGTSGQCIWRRTRTWWRRRRGMLLFSSVPWRSGAKKAGSSSIHTGSHSTRSPGRQRDRPEGGRRFEQKVNVALRCKKDILLYIHGRILVLKHVCTLIYDSLWQSRASSVK